MVLHNNHGLVSSNGCLQTCSRSSRVCFMFPRPMTSCIVFNRDLRISCILGSAVQQPRTARGQQRLVLTRTVAGRQCRYDIASETAASTRLLTIVPSSMVRGSPSVVHKYSRAACFQTSPAILVSAETDSFGEKLMICDCKNPKVIISSAVDHPWLSTPGTANPGPRRRIWGMRTRIPSQQPHNWPT